MLEGLKRRWKEARAENLRKEAEDSIQRLGSLPQEVNFRAADTFATAYRYLTQEYGPFENISNEGKLEISKMLVEKAREAFKMDMGRGYGLALLSMHVEASCLPGGDAQFVFVQTKQLLDAALQVAADVDRTLASKE